MLVPNKFSKKMGEDWTRVARWEWERGDGEAVEVPIYPSLATEHPTFGYAHLRPAYKI